MSDLIQTPPEDNLLNVQQPVDFLVGEVASYLGGGHLARQRAITALDRAADRMNMAGIFLFRRVEKEYTGLIDQQGTLEMPSDWGWPIDPGLVFDSNDNLIKIIEWKAWDVFQKLIIDPEENAIPGYASILSELDGVIHIWPKVDTSSVTTIKLTYVARIQRPSEVDDLLIMPEAREALLAGGVFFAMQRYYASRPNIWVPFQKDFWAAISGAKGAASRLMESTHFAPAPDLDGYVTSRNLTGLSNSQIAVGPAYIKVGGGG